MTLSQRTLQVFDLLPRRERWFVQIRMLTAPLEEIARRVPANGRIADVGCGHGALSAMLAVDAPERTVVGIDPDERKIAWAARAPGVLPNATFRTSTVEQLAELERGSFDAAVVADVLYLLPAERWGAFLRECRRLLCPGGLLLLKEAEASEGWKYRKCMLQEALMVRLLRRTRSSGALNFRPRAYLDGLLRQKGFRVVDTLDLSRGYSTPHVLFVAEAVE